MTDILRAAGIAVMAAVLVFLLREAGFRGAKIVGIIATVGLGAYAISAVGELSHGFGAAYFGKEIEEGAQLVLKIIGTGYVFGICADICRELGESGLATGVLAVGRVEILLLSLPTLREIIGLGIELMK